jgi:UDP-N-acetylmuramate dehydrogenase
LLAKDKRIEVIICYFCEDMVVVRENVDLGSFNTFKIKARCRYFAEIHSIEDFQSLLGTKEFKENRKLILGGGSNLLFTKDFDGIVIKNNLKGISILGGENGHVTVKAAAGEVWHEFVQFTMDKGFAGLENLSLIPGCVGASPMQNIGAYGVEIKEVFEELEAYSLVDGSKRLFTNEECHFGYRESVFKNVFKDQYFIASVTFRLNTKPNLNTSYGAINTELQAMNISQPGIKDVSQAVINIRRSKLPDPAVTGNAGSFFKNPEVPESNYQQLKEKFTDLVAYPLANGHYKLAAGWLIEQCGLKGYQHKGAAVHSKQALVLVNTGNAEGKDLLELSEIVMQNVNEKFGVKLEREVNII